MSDRELVALAREAGLEPRWVDATGEACDVAPEILRRILETMALPCATAAQIAESRELLRQDEAAAETAFVVAAQGEPIRLGLGAVTGSSAALRLETGERMTVRPMPAADGCVLPPVMAPGYHNLEIGERSVTVAVAPGRAVGVEDIAPGRRLWGLAAQIYALRADHDADFGDFGALAAFAEAAAAQGADALAVSPSHALFAADPTRFSPYAPSTRLFLNVLYADPAAVFGTDALAGTAGLEPVAAGTGGPELVDWPAAAAAKLRWLRQLFDRFRADGDGERRRAFERFRAEGGDLLEDHARFEALHAYFLGTGGADDWRRWPDRYRDPASPAVAGFARDHAGEVEYHLFLQWLADCSLASAQGRARRAGMAIGLVADLAVGMDGAGSHAWSHGDDVLAGLSIGAPPDLLGPLGQDWGLTTFSPRALRKHGFAPFLATLRAAMRHAGGIRIDHVMGLTRLWVIPQGAAPTEGAYLRYPLAEMLRLTALESHRHRSIVIGEDLGTVPEGFHVALDRAGVMGMRVLWFERDGCGGFTAPRLWSREAVAMTTTHDLPTVAGWWRGRDIDWRSRLGHLSQADESRQRQERDDDRGRLWQACVEAGCAEGRRPGVDAPGRVVAAALAFVAMTPCRLAIVPAEDVMALEEQPNLPGTVDEHPNWRRRLPEVGLDAPAVRARLERLSRGRAQS